MQSFLRLNQLFENADILGLGYLDSEELPFWIVIEKQTVERECRHRRWLPRQASSLPVLALLSSHALLDIPAVFGYDSAPPTCNAHCPICGNLLEMDNFSTWPPQ